MKNPLSICIALGLGLLTLPVSAETLRQQADRICHAFIEHPEEFKKIEMTDCKAKMIGYDTLCFDHTDPVKKIKRTYASFPSTGTCHSSGISEVNSDRTAKILPLRNSTVNGYNFGGNDSALDYKGQLFFTDGNDLRLPLDDDEVVLCSFLYKIDDWQAPTPKDNPVCKKFADRDYTIISQPIPEAEQSQWPDYPEAQPFVHYSADLDADGHKETIVGYDYSSGAGCGCDAIVLALPENGELVGAGRGQPPGKQPHSSQIIALGRSLDSITRTCRGGGNPSSIITIENRDYVLIDYKSTSESSDLSHFNRNIPTRMLYEYRNGQFEKICSQQASTKRVIAHEIYKANQLFYLNYKPLE